MKFDLAVRLLYLCVYQCYALLQHLDGLDGGGGGGGRREILTEQFFILGAQTCILSPYISFTNISLSCTVCDREMWVFLARRQGQWKGENFSLSFLEEAAKMLRVVLHMMYFRTRFSIHAYYNSFGGYRKLSQSQYPVLL